MALDEPVMAAMVAVAHIRTYIQEGDKKIGLGGRVFVIRSFSCSGHVLTAAHVPTLVNVHCPPI